MLQFLFSIHINKPYYKSVTAWIISTNALKWNVKIYLQFGLLYFTSKYMTTWLIQTLRTDKIMVYILRPYLLTNPHLMYMTPSKGMSNISFGAQDVRKYIILCSLYIKTFLQVCQDTQKKWLHPIKHVDNFIHNLTATKRYIDSIRKKLILKLKTG